MSRSWSLVGLLIVSMGPFAVLPQTNLGVSELAASPLAAAIASPAAASTDLTRTTSLPLIGVRRAEFEAFVADALAQCGAPGASVAVVQDGTVVYLEGFGVRELGQPRPMTPDTLLGIGSLTKSFTATLAATLVDAGRVEWDTPVVALLPEFALSDPERTERLTLSDLFSAASGLPRRDLELIFEADGYTPDAMLAATKELPLTAPRGERYQYSNQAFVIGGYAAAAADGAAPDNLQDGYGLSVKARVLNPAGMDRSTFDLKEVLRSGDYAIPYASNSSGHPVAIPFLVEDRFTRAVAPAGAMWSTARDMARYLQMQLNRGVAVDGTRVVSEDNLERTWQRGVAVPPAPELPPIVSESMENYGLGWFIGHYGGLEVISHSGGTYGFGAEVAFVPEADLGVVVLANDVLCGALVGFAVQYRLFEIVFDQEPAVEEGFVSFLKAVESQQAAVAGMLSTIDPGDLSPFMGKFTHPTLGEVELRLVEGELVLDAGEFRSRLAPLPGIPGLAPQYVMVDPPLNGAPVFVSLASKDGAPRAVLTLLGDYGQGPLVYPFLPVDPTPAA